jgi:hypothetical protein
LSAVLVEAGFGNVRSIIVFLTQKVAGREGQNSQPAR